MVAVFKEQTAEDVKTNFVDCRSSQGIRKESVGLDSMSLGEILEKKGPLKTVYTAPQTMKIIGNAKTMKVN